MTFTSFCEEKEGEKNPLETMKNPFLFCFTKSFSSHFFVPEEYEKLTIRSEEKIDTSAKISLFLIHEKNLFPNKN